MGVQPKWKRTPRNQLSTNQSTGSAWKLKNPRPVHVHPNWNGASSPRRVLACGRINGAGQALYHAYSVLLPVRHAQRLVIRCARPFVYICFIVPSQRHIPARLSRSQSCWFPWSTRSSSSPSSPSGTWSYSPPSFWRAVRRRLPKRRERNPPAPGAPSGWFVSSQLARSLATEAPPSTKVAREGIATPGQSTKHPSQLNHPCSHSQACMPSVRSMCSPPTQPGQPGH